MAIRYLYLDDEAGSESTQSLSRIISDPDVLEIVPDAPKDFSDEVRRLSQVLNEYQGLILDWRLDQFAPAEDSSPRAFRAGAIAQELRSRASDPDRRVAGLPIVLWSTQDRLVPSYSLDDTSHDLFDAKYLKTEEVANESDRVKKELIALAEGYKSIFAYRDRADKDTALSEILGLSQEQLAALDPSLTYRMAHELRMPAHIFARFILNELIGRPGPLISERSLGARLGVELDPEASLDWENLKTKIANAMYVGPFHQGWPRWWSHLIDSWWNSLGGDSPPLRALVAEERVTVIRESTGLETLSPALPIEPTYSTQFQTICEYYGRPLDPVDGVVIDESEPEAWQRRRYMSLKAAWERPKKPRPHPSEHARLREIRSELQD